MPDSAEQIGHRADSPDAAQFPDMPPKLMSAGAPGWYSLVATCFFICEFNPFGAIGVAAGLANARGNALGWALTAASFMLALTGFIYAERRAWLEGNRRALEIGSIITIAAGVIPCLSAISMPAAIMWPIGAMFLIIGASGLRARRALPNTETPPDGATTDSGMVADSAAIAAESVATPQHPPKRRRKRRHRRSRGRRPPS